jgi:rhodanese-related sulfurtransferase
LLLSACRESHADKKKAIEDPGKVVKTAADSAEKNADSCFNKIIGADEAKELSDTSVLFVLDVRTLVEYNAGHIGNAVLIPLQQLEGRLKELTGYRDKNILVYCRSGSRSKAAVRVLVQNGFNRIYELDGGIVSWYRAGFKIVR